MDDNRLQNSRRLTLGLGWGVLLSSIVWTALVVALSVNALHAPLAKKTPRMEQFIWMFAIFTVLAGMVGMGIGVSRVFPKVRWGWVVAAWLGATALCIGLAAMAHPRLEGHWPWMQMLLGTLLCAMILAGVWISRQIRQQKGS